MTYEEIGRNIGALVQEKQAAYGDSFSKAGAVMRILYPDGISPEKMDDALTIVRMLDKMFRIATDRDALGESPFRDLAGYSLLSVKRVESAKQNGTEMKTGPCQECGKEDVKIGIGGWCFDCFAGKDVDTRIHVYSCQKCGRAYKGPPQGSKHPYCGGQTCSTEDRE